MIFKVCSLACKCLLPARRTPPGAHPGAPFDTASGLLRVRPSW